MSRLLSWREVANLLADRLVYHNYCDAHTAAEADPGNCPFCADRAAYQAWQAKSGQRHVPLPPGPVLDVLAEHAEADRARRAAGRPQDGAG